MTGTVRLPPVSFSIRSRASGLHELAIASSVVEIARRHAGDRRVTRVELKVGHHCQVVPDALTFSFGLVAQGTVVEGAELVSQSIPAVGAHQ
jgi:hydrogenase nickel incorporation protein HypA/HybF